MINLNLNTKQILTIGCSILSILSIVLSISAMRKPFQVIHYNGEIYKPVIYSDSIIYTSDPSFNSSTGSDNYFHHFNSDQSVLYIHVLSILSEILLCFYIIVICHNVRKPMKEIYETIDFVSLTFPFISFAFLITSSSVSNNLNVDICENIGQCVNFKLKSDYGDNYSKSSIGYNLIIASTCVAGILFISNLARFYLLKNRI